MGVSSGITIRSIGLRATPSRIHYAVVESQSPFDHVELLALGALAVPAALELPDRLSFVRTTILDIIAEFEVRRAGIRLIEYTAKTKPVERLNLEGVLQELLSSSEVEGYFAGAIARIGGLLGESDKTKVKRYFDGETFMGVQGWNTRSLEEREAVVTAVAALAVGTGVR